MDFLKQYVEIIEVGLAEIDFPDSPETLYEPQRYVLEGGGKRFRPVLTLLGCGLCGGNPKDGLPAALAVELLHNFTLMHDDIMDQADSRRGRESVHVKWNLSTAILAGDGMFTQALLQLQHLPESVDHKKISKEFLYSVNRVCEGQALDMEFETQKTVSSREYLQMIDGKTGALVRSSLKMGGMVAGAESGQLEKLDETGRLLGLAFQIQDDWLDVVADPEKFGKKQAGDIYEGKKTYLMTLALENSNKDEKKWLLDCLNSKPLKNSDVTDIIQFFKSKGILLKAEQEKEFYYSEAKKIVQSFDDSIYKQDLIKLIQTLKDREY